MEDLLRRRLRRLRALLLLRHSLLNQVLGLHRLLNFEARDLRFGRSFVVRHSVRFIGQLAANFVQLLFDSLLAPPMALVAGGRRRRSRNSAHSERVLLLISAR